MAFIKNTATSLIIGRKAPANIVVNQDHISAQHAQIIQNESNDMYIIDLNSSNGIYINGKKINPSQPHKLDINDIAKLGYSSNVQIRYLNE
jgi:pSer/pThr/pTyr-binding forkhead associated (FHA) protein